MPTTPEDRPTKVLQRVRDERRRLNSTLEKLTPAEMFIPGVVNDQTVKDVVAHIMEWEAMFFPWYEASLRGETPAVPAEGLTMHDLKIVNRSIYEKHFARPLEDILADFHTVHQRLEETVDAMTPEERETPGVFSFTSGSSIIDFMKAYAAHDMWAKRKIQAWMKSRLAGKSPEN